MSLQIFLKKAFGSTTFPQSTLIVNVFYPSCLTMSKITSYPKWIVASGLASNITLTPQRVTRFHKHSRKLRIAF